MQIDMAGRKILIADDERAIADGLAKSLEKRIGCETIAVYSGDAALESLSASRFDVLVTDMMMPGIHGFELLDRVKQGGDGIPIIVMTAYPDDFPYVDAIYHGADSFVVKPCRIEELQAQVIRMVREAMQREAVERSRRELELDLASAKDSCLHYQVNVNKYRSLFEFSLLGSAIINPSSYQIIEVNRIFCEMTGYSDAEIQSSLFSTLIAAPDKQRFESGLGVFAETSRGTLADVGMVTRNGNKLSVDMGFNFVDGKDGRLLIATIRDVGEHHEMQRRLVDEASRDDLTGLLNKRTFYSRLDMSVKAARHKGQPLSLMFMDLDNFKACNDTMGHQTGDELLKCVGEIILKTIRTDRDSPFRFGGDEFAVLLAGIGTDIAQKVGERIRVSFLNHERYGTSISIGITELNGGMDVEDFVGAADSALYKAKAAGKNTICLA